MAFEFKRDGTVLFFGPRAHVYPGPRKAREYLLWPFWAYRVVAPQKRHRQINTFQKAVLGMCRAGVAGFEKIGVRLHIHPDLAGFVAQELQAKGLLDANWIPTESGITTLESESVEDQEVVTGYVFQDPWYGELLPRFAKKLEYVELEYGESGYPNLMLDSEGKAWRQYAFMELPGRGIIPAEPDPRQISRAIQRHESASKFFKPFPWNDDRDDQGTAPEGPGSLERIALVDENPLPLFLTTYLYLPEGEQTGTDWYVSDPFGLAPIPSFRRQVEKRMKESGGLRGVVDRLLGKRLGSSLEKHLDWVAALKEKAKMQVESVLTLEALRLPAYRDLVDMQFNSEEAELLGEECPDQKMREVLTAARRALESTMGEIRETHPCKGVWQGLSYKDRDYNSKKYEEAAAALGLSTPIPDAFTGVKKTMVKAVSDYKDSWRLRPMIISAMLQARSQQDHPFRKAAQENPQLLRELDEVIASAGEASHAGDHRRNMTLVRDTVKRVYAVVAVLSGLGGAEEQYPTGMEE
ncbi:hypothetical protein ACFL4N_04025 [Thermodesulfobacteriota bacterium]